MRAHPFFDSKPWLDDLVFYRRGDDSDEVYLGRVRLLLVFEDTLAADDNSNDSEGGDDRRSSDAHTDDTRIIHRRLLVLEGCKMMRKAAGTSTNDKGVPFSLWRHCPEEDYDIVRVAQLER